MNLAQVLINSVITAAELGIIAVGLTLTFSLLKFANFAHVETAVAGGYLAWVFNVGLGANFALSIVIAVLTMGLVGILFDPVDPDTFADAALRLVFVYTGCAILYWVLLARGMRPTRRAALATHVSLAWGAYPRPQRGRNAVIRPAQVGAYGCVWPGTAAVDRPLLQTRPPMAVLDRGHQ